MPYFAIDKIQWKPNWVKTPSKTYKQEHEKIVSYDSWLIDGYGSWDSVIERFNASDTIIFIDHPLWLHYWWATKRQIKSIFVGRPDGPEGCPMLPVTFRLYKMMWWLHYDMRPKLIKELEQMVTSKRVIHIRSPRELNAFVKNPV